MYVLNTTKGFITPAEKSYGCQLIFSADFNRAASFAFWTEASDFGARLVALGYVESYVVLSNKSE